MAKYKRKPNIVEAFKWTGDVEQTEDPEWLVEKMNSGEVIVCSETTSFYDDSKGITVIWLEIETLEGTMRADQGDYIVKGIKGEVYPCKPDIFEANHEIIEHDND